MSAVRTVTEKRTLALKLILDLRGPGGEPLLEDVRHYAVAVNALDGAMTPETVTVPLELKLPLVLHVPSVLELPTDVEEEARLTARVVVTVGAPRRSGG